MAHHVAVITAIATALLIVLGGLVTNTGAALAVPDWPTTFGHNMFLFPWAEMVGGVFYEHSHRLAGAVVGLLTLVLAAVLFRVGHPLRWLGLAAVALVIIQGLLGGFRVVLLAEALAIVHGVLAQCFFALIVVVAYLTSSRSASAVRDGRVGTAVPRGLALASAVAVFVQIVFGALVTHAGRVDLHLAAAVLVYALVPMLAARLRRSDDAVAQRAGRALLVLLALQLVLGLGAFAARFTALALPGEQLTGLALPVAHRLLAAFILATVTIAAIRVWRMGGARGTLLVSPDLTPGTAR